MIDKRLKNNAKLEKDGFLFNFFCNFAGRKRKIDI